MREGDVDAYVLFEAQRGRITVADDPTGAMRAQLADWWQATRTPPGAGVGAGRAASQQRRRAQRQRPRTHARRGRLGDDEITVDDRSFAAGDRVVLLRNNKTLDVDNGDRGLVVDVDADRRALTVELDAGREVRIPDWYLDAGWVDHGYALTAHKLQSTTVDRTFALASDGLYQEAGYSIATRARHETHFYLASQPDLADHEHAHGPPQPPEDAITRFARHLNASRAQTLASDEPAHAHARALTTTELREEHDRVWRALDDFPAHQARALEGLAGDAERQRTDLEDTELRIGQANHQLDSLGFFKRHGSEGDDLRRQLERLQSQHAYVDGRYSRTSRDPQQRADNDPVAWVDRNADNIRYLRALEEELAARERRTEYQLVPPANTTRQNTSPPCSAHDQKTTLPASHGSAAYEQSRPTATGTASTPTTTQAPSDPNRTRAPQSRLPRRRPRCPPNESGTRPRDRPAPTRTPLACGTTQRASRTRSRHRTRRRTVPRPAKPQRLRTRQRTRGSQPSQTFNQQRTQSP